MFFESITVDRLRAFPYYFTFYFFDDCCCLFTVGGFDSLVLHFHQSKYLILCLDFWKFFVARKCLSSFSQISVSGLHICTQLQYVLQVSQIRCSTCYKIFIQVKIIFAIAECSIFKIYLLYHSSTSNKFLHYVALTVAVDINTEGQFFHGWISFDTEFVCLRSQL